MSYFSQYRHLYKLPERRATDSTSRALRVLERERQKIELMDDRALQGRGARLSQVDQDHLKLVQNMHARIMAEHKADIESAATRSRARKSSRDLKVAMSGLLQRERLSSARLTRAAFERAKASAADRRSYHPSRDELVNPRTVFGTEALIGSIFRSRLGVRYSRFAKGRLGFLSPTLAIPCVQRSVRKEVLFARDKAGRGYKVPHRRSPYSGIDC